MQVALLSPCGPAHNAIGRQLAGKAAFFHERGAAVRVFVESCAGLEPELLPFTRQVDQVAANGPVWDYLAGADLVIADYPQHYALLHFLALLVHHKPRRVLDYHGVTPASFWQGPQRALLEESARQRGLVWCADFALAHSEFAKHELHEATGYPRARILVLPYATDTALFRPGRSDRLRRGLGVSEGPLLLYVGRVAASKRLPVLVEALRHLPAAHTVIVGDDRDVYGAEAEHCRVLAEQMGVADRLHFLGQVSDTELAEIYRGADVLMVPSRHEGYCLPVIEAMASGLPVVAARTSALPETIGDAGLTFTPDDAEDLARQVRRVLERRAGGVSPLIATPSAGMSLGHEIRRLTPPAHPARRIAIVAFRFGSDIIGGAERSLCTTAAALQSGGDQVEVFTTCTRSECDWRNQLPAGSTVEDGLLVHRFPIDPHDRARHHEAIRRIVEARGQVDTAGESDYLANSIHSTALLDALKRRRGDFEAIIVGPYLFGLTHDVAHALPEQTLLLPCFHEEPLAHLQAWRATYARVAGILYHSIEEQDFAERVLGLNHPRALEIGSWLASSGAPTTTNRAAPGPYVIYCGRYSQQKNLPLLLEYAARYHPGRLRFAFAGAGEVRIPAAPWALDLGRISEAEKATVLAGAAALVQLSVQESLSLVALEAWQQGTPIIVHEQCAVLGGQVRRSGGGVCVGDYRSFAAALDDLGRCPDAWREMGQRGHDYVRRHYCDQNAFRKRIVTAIDSVRTPLGECMHRRGLARASQRGVAPWRRAFAEALEKVLDTGPIAARLDVEIQPQAPRCRVSSGNRTVLVPVRLRNRGTLPALADGPARASLVAEVIGEHDGQPLRLLSHTGLAGMLQPGTAATVMALASVPSEPREYQLMISVECPAWTNTATKAPASATLPLIVGESRAADEHAWIGPLLDAAGAALAEAHRLRRLPDDYLDVTEGWFARGKRWLKRKLLGNFKKGYVDVLSRQQSQVNGQLIVAVQELAQSCAALDHAVRQLQARLDKMDQTDPAACRLAEPSPAALEETAP